MGNPGFTCRLCAIESCTGKPLISPDRKKCHSFINRYLPINILRNDMHPNWICFKCDMNLESTMKFFKLIEKRQPLLKILKTVPNPISAAFRLPGRPPNQPKARKGAKTVAPRIVITRGQKRAIKKPISYLQSIDLEELDKQCQAYDIHRLKRPAEAPNMGEICNLLSSEITEFFQSIENRHGNQPLDSQNIDSTASVSIDLNKDLDIDDSLVQSLIDDFVSDPPTAGDLDLNNNGMEYDHGLEEVQPMNSFVGPIKKTPSAREKIECTLCALEFKSTHSLVRHEDSKRHLNRLTCATTMEASTLPESMPEDGKKSIMSAVDNGSSYGLSDNGTSAGLDKAGASDGMNTVKSLYSVGAANNECVNLLNFAQY